MVFGLPPVCGRSAASEPVAGYVRAVTCPAQQHVAQPSPVALGEQSIAVGAVADQQVRNGR